MKSLKKMGVPILAPPIWVLLKLGKDQKLAASRYAIEAKKQGLRLITWSLERSPIDGWYYQGLSKKLKHEGDIFFLIEALDKEVGVEAIFSDWPASVSFYANCIKKH